MDLRQLRISRVLDEINIWRPPSDFHEIDDGDGEQLRVGRTKKPGDHRWQASRSPSQTTSLLVNLAQGDLAL